MSAIQPVLTAAGADTSSTSAVIVVTVDGADTSTLSDGDTSTFNIDANASTFMRTLYNGLNTLTGIGLLSIPYALSEGGWLSLIAFFLASAICYYTALMLMKCMDTNPNIKTYPDIGFESFGNKGRIIVSILIHLELFLIAIELIIMGADNLHKLFPDVKLGKSIGGQKTFILISTLVMLPTTWLNLSVLAYASACGIFCSAILIALVLWIGIEHVGFDQNGTILKYKGLSTAISMYTFCFCGHAIFPTLYTSMRQKNRFPKVLQISFISTTLMYVSMAVIGYLMFGENLLSQITLNLPIKSISTKVAIWMTLLNPFTKYALVINPIATAFEEKLPNSGNNNNNDNNNRLVKSLMIKTVLVAITAVIALVVPFFASVMQLIGSCFSVCGSILCPCICYVKMKQISQMELVIIVIICLLGLFVGGIGTYTSIVNIVKNLNV